MLTYVAYKDIDVIKSNLSEDMNAIGSWLDQNTLTIHLNNDKTESLLFRTSQPSRLVRQGDIQCDVPRLKYIEYTMLQIPRH